MATKDEVSEQLNLSTKLAAVVDRMAATYDHIEKSYQTQISSAEKLAVALNAVNTQGSVKAVEDLHKSMKDAAKQTDQTSTSLSKKLTPGLGAAAGALGGLAQGFSNLVAGSKSLFGFFTGVISWLGNVAASILAIPLKILTGLIDLAANAGGGMDELRREIEEVRKEFGKLSGPTAKAILDTTATIKGFSDTGLSAWQIFGTVAERLKLVRELAVAMGASFTALRQEFIDNGGALLAYQKGLGLSHEMMKTMGDYAISMGKPISKVLNAITKQALDLGDAFEIDSKLISKDMAKAMQDVKHFAGATVKEIATASVYARKLGMELEKITGILDAFETFDSAAENAAKLSQSFGLTVDAFKMMDAQDPASQIEMLRDQFKMAGKDASTFNRQQIKLLATSTGLTEDTARQAFSMKNQGMSLDAIKKKSETAEKKTLSQAEAMGKLADAIERLVMSGGSQMGGFFDMFMKGFFEGIQSTKEFREIIWHIKTALMQTYMAGVQLGRVFVKLFPGMQEFLGGIADFFQPEKFRKLTSGVVAIFTDFFEKLSTGKWSFGELMKGLQEKFFNFFDSELPAGKKMLTGFKKILKTISGIVAEGIKWIANQLVEVFKFIADVIQDPKKLTQAAAGGEGALGFLSEILVPLLDALKHAWKVLAPAVWDLLSILGKKIYKFLSSDEFLNFVKPAVPYIAAALFGPMFGRAIIGAFATTMGTQVAKGISGWVSGAGKNLLPGAGPSKMDVAAAKELQKGAGIKWSDVLKVIVAIAAVVAIGMRVLAIAIIAIRAFDIKTDEIAKALAMVGGIAIAMMPVALIVGGLSKIKINISSVLAGIGAMALTIGAMAVTMAALYFSLKGIDPSKMRNILDAIMIMSKVYAIAGVVVMEAMLIGAALILSSGLAAGAGLSGFAAIASAVGAMTEHAIQIMKKLQHIDFASGLKEKIDMFVSVLNAMTGFARVFVDIFKALKPSFKFFQDEDPTEMQRNIDSATKFVSMMAEGMIGLVKEVISAIRFLGGAPEATKRGAELFATLLQAITSLAQAINPPKEAFDTDATWFKIETNDAKRNVLQGMSDFVATMTSSLSSLIDKVKQFIVTFTHGQFALTDADVMKMQGLSGLFGLVTTLVGALKPDPAVINAAKTGVVGLGTEGVMAKIGDMVRDQGIALKNIMTTIAMYIGPLMKSVPDVSPEKMKTLNVIMPLITSVLGVLTSLSGVVSNVLASKMPQGTEPIRAAYGMLDSLKDILPKVITSIAEVIGPMAEKLSSITFKGDVATMNKNMTMIKSTVEVLNTLPPIITSATALAGLRDKDAALAFLLNMMNMSAVLGIMTAPDSPASIVTMGKMISDAKVEAIDTKKVIAFATMLNNVKDVMVPLRWSVDAIATAAASFPKDGIAPAVAAVADAIKQVQALDDALAKLPKMDVSAKLGVIAKAVGLGSKGAYTVKSKEVILMVNFAITMDVGEVEKVMIMRKQSTIRDRIEFATVNNVGHTANTSIPETYSPAPIPQVSPTK